jgi:hypothetical protein
MSATTICTEHMDETLRHFTMLTSEFVEVIICIGKGDPNNGDLHAQVLDGYKSGGLQFQLPDAYPRHGYLPQLAADVFALKFCACKQRLCRPGEHVCVLCLQAPTYASTRTCVICLETCKSVGKKCLTCADGIVCTACLYQCKDQTTCPVCKVAYPAFLKRKHEESDDDYD